MLLKIKSYKDIIIYFVLLLALAGGIFFSFILVAYYLYEYFTDVANTLRHEYLEGVFLSLYMSSPFWFVVSVIAFFIRKEISKKIFWLINAPFIIVAMTFTLMNVYIIIQIIIEKITT